jgi:aspartate carbamoyltransferase catalytic subunit
MAAPSTLTQALAKFNGNRFFFIAPDALAMPQYILDMLDEKGISGACTPASKR